MYFFVPFFSIKINLWHASMLYEVNTSFEAGLWEQPCLEPLSESDKIYKFQLWWLVWALSVNMVQKSALVKPCLLKMSLQLILQLFCLWVTWWASSWKDGRAGGKLGGNAGSAKQATYCSWVTRTKRAPHEVTLTDLWDPQKTQQENTERRYGIQTMGSASLHIELKGWMAALDSILSHPEAKAPL